MGERLGCVYGGEGNVASVYLLPRSTLTSFTRTGVVSSHVTFTHPTAHPYHTQLATHTIHRASQHTHTPNQTPHTPHVVPEFCGRAAPQIQHARGFARFFEGKNVAIVFSDAEERNMFVDDETYGMLTVRLLLPDDNNSNATTTLDYCCLLLLHVGHTHGALPHQVHPQHVQSLHVNLCTVDSTFSSTACCKLFRFHMHTRLV